MTGISHIQVFIIYEADLKYKANLRTPNYCEGGQCFLVILCLLIQGIFFP